MHNKLLLLDLHKKSAIDNFAELKETKINSSKKNSFSLSHFKSRNNPYSASASRIDSFYLLNQDNKINIKNSSKISDVSLNSNSSFNIMSNKSNTKIMSDNYSVVKEVTLDDIDKFSGNPK